MATFVGILANLAKIQRDDGALNDNVVTLDALGPAVMEIREKLPITVR